MFSKWSLAQNKKDLFIQVLIIIPRILFKDIHDTKFMKNNLIACTTKFKSVVPPVNCACDVITNRIVLNKGRAWIWAQHPYMSFMHEHPNQSGNKTAWRSSLSIFHVLCPPRYFPSVAPVTPPPRALSCDVWRLELVHHPACYKPNNTIHCLSKSTYNKLFFVHFKKIYCY